MESAYKKRGKLTIYLGYSPGVGKTYEMLSNGIDLYKEGADIKIGYIEPHQRPETRALAQKLPEIMTSSRQFGSHTFQYIDVDKIIEAHPDVILIDELAHTNISKERHLKRYMDIEEILSHGIDVWTTLNIQHIESLSGQITLMTGIQVTERVPDQFVISADAYEVVDVSPDMLIQRMKAGKVYKKERLETAFSHFFTYENLTELRELTLRTVADIMSQKEQQYKTKHTDITPHIAVAVSGSIYNERVIREARRTAYKENAKLTAVYIDVFETAAESKKQDHYVHKNLMLAQSLGAEIKIFYAQDIAKALTEWCDKAFVTKLVLGQSEKPRWKGYFKKSLIDQMNHMPHHFKLEIVPLHDIHIENMAQTTKQNKMSSTRWSMDVIKMVMIQALCVLIGTWVYNMDKNESSAMILLMFFIGIIVLSIWTQSYLIGFFASILNVFVFNYFFTVPRFTLEMYRFEYPITFATSIFASIFTSAILKNLKHQHLLTERQLYRTNMMLHFNQSIKESYSMMKLLKIAGEQIHQLLNQDVTVFLIQQKKVTESYTFGSGALSNANPHEETETLGWVIENEVRAGKLTDTFPGSPYLCIPIGTVPVKGVISIRFNEEDYIDTYDNSILESMLNDVTLAIENVDLLRQTRQSMLRAEREATRSNFLHSISHDIRTPLTTIMGNLDMLKYHNRHLSEAAVDSLLSASYDEAQYLYTLVTNILSLTKLESAEIQIQRSPYLVEELLEEFEEGLERRHQNQKVKIKYDAPLALIDIDSQLILQVLFNLVDNALLHAESKSDILLNVYQVDHKVKFEMIDFGKGIPEEKRQLIFNPFYSEDDFKDNQKDSLGLGLYLIQRILQQHESQLKYQPNTPKGSIFYFYLDANQIEMGG
ncbi:sensor histidine kinase [Staphylococcus lutrae]|uniref:histidine kinase n=1 Tax=Staphylococcus lutrae TaxID=155085 RepID=A0AAC9RNN9_9STAP|nr:sensor histidine kinase KdpD [Staphylococcus lutrae]ARJ50858.1 sensor histidine kinase [Staphylococcus lutrae]PNZ39845.1 sensor histidine kinase KdpD [Staphylococcus lutrae]